MFSGNSSELNSYSLTPTKNDRNQMANDALLVNLFEVVNNELRSLRQRINSSDEGSQDRHNQLIQFLFSIINSSNSNNQNNSC